VAKRSEEGLLKGKAGEIRGSLKPQHRGKGTIHRLLWSGKDNYYFEGKEVCWLACLRDELTILEETSGSPSRTAKKEFSKKESE